MQSTRKLAFASRFVGIRMNEVLHPVVCSYTAAHEILESVPLHEKTMCLHFHDRSIVGLRRCLEPHTRG
jgi:hypothetical protein